MFWLLFLIQAMIIINYRTVDAKYYSSLVNDNASPLLNRATQSFIAPGSTYKPCTIIAGIDSGIISSSTTFNCSGVFDKVTPSLDVGRNGDMEVRHL